jgi:hypothetical protein
LRRNDEPSMRLKGTFVSVLNVGSSYVQLLTCPLLPLFVYSLLSDTKVRLIVEDVS